jgi:hypothetical protein
LIGLWLVFKAIVGEELFEDLMAPNNLSSIIAEIIDDFLLILLANV